MKCAHTLACGVLVVAASAAPNDPNLWGVSLSPDVALAESEAALARLQPEVPVGEAAPAPPETRVLDKERGAENNAAVNEFSPGLESSIAKGLAWLARQQAPDGSFGNQQQWGPNVAVTSLSALAFMSDGHLPDRGAYGPVVSKALAYILANAADNGLVASDAGAAPMYGHGFATIFLGEIYGMTAGGPDTATAARVHDALVRSVRLIVSSQNDEGGWRYNPVPNDADVSVTICQIKGLRSARNAGIEVPRETIDRAVEYVKKCQNSGRGGDGGFRYQLTGNPASGFARSAAGVASLQYAGIYDDPAVREGLAYIERSRGAQRAGRAQHYYYGHYYAMQTMYLAGGTWWAKWWPDMRDELLNLQKDDGSWDDNQVGDHYGTAMALIILQSPKRYLPIFQR